MRSDVDYGAQAWRHAPDDGYRRTIVRHGRVIPTFVTSLLLATLNACGDGSGTGGDPLGGIDAEAAGDAPGFSAAGFEIAPQFVTGTTRATPETFWHCRGDGGDETDVFHFGADGGGTLASGVAADPLPIEWLAVDGGVDVTLVPEGTGPRLAEIAFESPVRFATTYESGGMPYAERACELHAPDGTPLAEPPHATPYGAASYDRPSPPLGAALPPALSLAMIHEFGIDGFGSTRFDRSAVVLFDDGSFTRDVAGVLLRGIAGSRAARPEDWGEWRGDAAAGSLELREGGDGFDEVSAVAGSAPASDRPLEGCYESEEFVSVPGAGIGAGAVGFSSNVYCFFADGTFDRRRVSSVVSPEVTAGASSGGTGRYRIEGDAIDLEFDDGTLARHVLGRYAAEGDPRFAVSLDATVLARSPSDRNGADR